MWWLSFVENDHVARTSRETRCRSVQLHRSTWLVLRSAVLITIPYGWVISTVWRMSLFLKTYSKFTNERKDSRERAVKDQTANTFIHVYAWWLHSPQKFTEPRVVALLELFAPLRLVPSAKFGRVLVHLHTTTILTGCVSLSSPGAGHEWWTWCLSPDHQSRVRERGASSSQPLLK